MASAASPPSWRRACATFLVGLGLIVCGADPSAHAQGANPSERAAFESAKELGTAAAFDAFLANYPSGFYADLARAYQKKLGGANAAVPSAAPLAPAQRFPGVTGFNLVSAYHSAGVFLKNGPDSWVEQFTNGAPVFRFKEVGRTDREVQLFDRSRSVYIGLDVTQAIIWYSDSSQPRRPLYEITRAEAGAAATAPAAAAPYGSYPKPAPRATGCEEGWRQVNGQCVKIRAGEKPGGCPPGTHPVPETDNCVPIKKVRKPLRCKSGYIKLEGKCIRRNEAASYCGPGYRPQGGKCVPGAYQAPPKGTKRPQWQIDAIKKGCKPGQGWNAQEGCHEND